MFGFLPGTGLVWLEVHPEPLYRRQQALLQQQGAEKLLEEEEVTKSSEKGEKRKRNRDNKATEEVTDADEASVAI